MEGTLLPPKNKRKYIPTELISIPPNYTESVDFEVLGKLYEFYDRLNRSAIWFT